MSTKNISKKDNIVSSIISWTIFVLLFLIALFLLFYVISIQFYNKNDNSKSGPSIYLYTIISGSMDPAIKVYDVVFDVRVKDPHDIKEGDIITFVSGSSLTYGYTITHRVVGVVEEDGKVKFKTKGDNNPNADESYTDFENVVGKVLFKIPQLGRIQFLLLKTGSWLFLILIPVLGIVIYDIIKVSDLFDTKKKIENMLNKKEKTIDKEKQDKLKAEIKNRLISNNFKNSIKEDNKVKEKVKTKVKVNNNIDLSKNSLKNRVRGNNDINLDKVLKKIDSNKNR